MRRYDFGEAGYFLNECVPLEDMYGDVCASLDMLSGRHLSKEKRARIWRTLLVCADFLETIAEKKPK